MNLEGKDYFTSQPLPGKNRNPSICLAKTRRHSNVSHEIDCPEPDMKSILLRSSIYCFTIHLPPLPHCLDLLFPLGAFSIFTLLHSLLHTTTPTIPTVAAGRMYLQKKQFSDYQLPLQQTRNWPPSQTGSATLLTE